MPYYVMRDLCFLKNLKRNKVSTGVSALKIFILICLKSEKNEQGIYSSSLTYDQINEYCSLSRKLISEGLKYLEENKVIEILGDRKKTYVLLNCRKNEGQLSLSRFNTSNGHWCKLPYRSFINEHGDIMPFKSIGNRNLVELNALKIYLYVLMVRSGGKAHSTVTLKTIKSRLNLSYQEIMIAIPFLNTVGFLEKVNIGPNSIGHYEETFSIMFLVYGWESLEWRPHYISNDDDDWKNELFDKVF